MIEGLRFVYTSAEVASALTARALEHERSAQEAIRLGNEAALAAADDPVRASEVRAEAQRDHDNHAELAVICRDLAAHVVPGERFSLHESLHDQVSSITATSF